MAKTAFFKAILENNIFYSLVLLYLMAVTISYARVNKLYNYCNGCLIKKLKLKAKLS